MAREQEYVHEDTSWYFSNKLFDTVGDFVILLDDDTEEKVEGCPEKKAGKDC